MKRVLAGFTLIELLIVVAIIGILAAIAVPNFLNAQVRAKVAKAQSNMRATGTALEMYFLDKNTYPRWAWDSWGNASHYMGFRDLTTPISYASSSAFDNPFKSNLQKDHTVADGRELDPMFELGTYKYSGGSSSSANSFDYSSFPRNLWLLESSGPDVADDYNAHNYPVVGLPYDSTNGLRSKGDLFRGGGVFVASWIGQSN
jgi:prepilin-type N-terminal cleavage/methylation domain-containing protein